MVREYKSSHISSWEIGRKVPTVKTSTNRAVRAIRDRAIANASAPIKWYGTKQKLTPWFVPMSKMK